MRIVVMIIRPYHSSILSSLDMQFNKHAVLLLHGRERWGIPFIHFFPRKNAFLTTFNASPKF